MGPRNIAVVIYSVSLLYRDVAGLLKHVAIFRQDRYALYVSTIASLSSLGHLAIGKPMGRFDLVLWGLLDISDLECNPRVTFYPANIGSPVHGDAENPSIKVKLY